MRSHSFNHRALCVSAVALTLGVSSVLIAQAPPPAQPQAPATAAAQQAPPVSPQAQVLGTQFEFVISVADGKGQPVAGLGRSEIKMSEDGIPAEILDVTPYPVPVQLTIAVDNGPASGDALSHYRSGLAGLVKALPPGVEVTLLTTSPQPRAVVRASMDQQRLLRAVNEFAPEAEAPRFTDTIVEFAKRYKTEFEKTKRLDSLPILLMVTTTAAEAVSYEVPEISEAFGLLKQRKAKVFIVSLSGQLRREGLAPINDNRQALIGIPVAQLTGGRYESISNSTRIATLLPEWGQLIAALHQRHANQMLVKVNRPGELTGPLRNPRIEVARAGLTGLVSLDGLP